VEVDMRDLLPLVGTALVWIPLAIELAATGEYWQAGVVVLVGAGVHSLIDNFVRPLLARYGRLTLPAFVVLVSMLGGAAVFGAAGALLGPLLVRLCVESLAIVSESHVEAPGPESVSRTGRDDDVGHAPVVPPVVPRDSSCRTA
jgi:predicted PurR-regulated permease PerM